MKISSLLILFIVLASPVNLTVSHQSAQNPIPHDTLIKLYRSECRGTCPSYELTVSADGTVVFEGRKHVKTKGVVKDRISEDKLKELISEFGKANYFSLRESYMEPSDGCQNMASDLPSAITLFQLNGRGKAISHYLGCWGKGESHFDIYPRALFILENKIDEIVGTNKWIK